MKSIRQLKYNSESTTGFRASVYIQFASKYVNVFINLVISMILARILTPKEYGTMSVITVFIGLFSILSNVGINAAVIQYRELTDEDCGALFSFTLILGVILAIAFCSLSIPLVYIYKDPQYIPLMIVASLSVVFQSANMVPNGMLIRDKKFLAIGIRTILTSLVCGIICVILALAGCGIYALVLNTVLSSLAVVLWNLAVSKLPMGIWDFRKQLKIVGKFSTYQFGSQLTQYFIRNLDTLLIGSVLGSTVLGYYDKAYKLAKYPVNIVPSTLNPVLKSFFSSAEGDKEKLFSSYFKVEKVLSILGIYFSVICFFAADELILVLFGEQWTQSVEPFRMLSVSIVFQMVNFTVFSVLEGAKRTDLLMRNTVISSIAMAALLVVGVYSGDLTLTAALVSAGFIVYTVSVIYYVIHIVFEKSVFSYIYKFVPEITSGIVTAIILYLSSPFMPADMMISLALKIFLGSLAYAVMLRITGQLGYVKAVIRQ